MANRAGRHCPGWRVPLFRCPLKTHSDAAARFAVSGPEIVRGRSICPTSSTRPREIHAPRASSRGPRRGEGRRHSRFGPTSGGARPTSAVDESRHRRNVARQGTTEARDRTREARERDLFARAHDFFFRSRNFLLGVTAARSSSARWRGPRARLRPSRRRLRRSAMPSLRSRPPERTSSPCAGAPSRRRRASPTPLRASRARDRASGARPRARRHDAPCFRARARQLAGGTSHAPSTPKPTWPNPSIANSRRLHPVRDAPSSSRASDAPERAGAAVGSVSGSPR
jgi:hypothetical protein